jgi:hypothetical protein
MCEMANGLFAKYNLHYDSIFAIITHNDLCLTSVNRIQFFVSVD